MTRIVAFGDSYADDGNLFELLGIPRPAAYPTGRFSGGTNFIDTMSQILAVPVDNFAIGGAFTNNGNINGPGIPGFVTEYQSFLAGGGPAAFPRVSGTFGPNDLLAISIGGNDARAYRISGGTVAGAAAAAAPRVAQATTGLTALVNAGARNITYLAGDVGRLPEAVGSPSAAAGSAFSSAFNTGMQSSLANFAANGVIVNYLDLNLIGDRITANPGAYGLVSAGACTGGAAGPTACVASPELANQYLFYVDQVHLSSAGFAIVARYAVRQLEAPLQFQAQPEVGLQAASGLGSTLLGRLDLSSARSGRAQQGFSAYLTGNIARRNVDRTLTNFAYDMETLGGTGGVEYAGVTSVFGAAVNYSNGEASTSVGEAEAKAIQLALYGGWGGTNGGFVEGYAGYGWVDYDFTRAAVIDDIVGETDGNNVFAGARAGYLFGTDQLRFGPVIGLSYAKADLDAYTETGDAVLTLNVGEQEVKVLTGSAGVEARASYEIGGMSFLPYAQATLEKDFEGDSRTIRYAGTASPTIVNSFVLPEQSKDLHGRLTGGASIALANALSLEVNASGTIEREDGNDFSALIGVKLGF
ncbi:MAG TPA: autotransporter domain-containing protein [Allosphingosinicella sp.]|uniref:autotransporter domain-containing protein n=1 Tax=Allosphingosinicella sp. TaxID=2823234 RepID=UPI002ED86C30